jgi:hypothetical protein
VGVMQRPGRLHITWENPSTLRVDADAGTQTRTLHFGPAAADKASLRGRGIPWPSGSCRVGEGGGGPY